MEGGNGRNVSPSIYALYYDLLTPRSKSLSLTDIRRRPDLGNRTQCMAYRLRVLSDSLTELASIIKDEHKTLEVLNRKYGLTSLPDDVLAMTFDLAVNERFGFCKWKTAVRLSHVCQHFRYIMLACPRMWTDMNTSSEMVASCAPRAKGVSLSVNFSVDTRADRDGWVFQPVLAELLTHAKRWGRLSMAFRPSSRDVLLQFEERNELNGQNLRHLEAPLLEELYIDGGDFDGAPRPYWDWTQWNTPKLRRIEAIYHFPRSLPGLVNVTSIDLTLRVHDDSMSGILGEISKLDHLQDLALCFTRCVYDENAVPHVKLEFPHVKRLEIKTELHIRIEDSTPAAKRSLFSSLFFPGVVHLKLSITGADFTEELLESEMLDKRIYNYYFNKEIARILIHDDQYPRVDDFHLKIRSPFGDHHDSEHGFNKALLSAQQTLQCKAFHVVVQYETGHRGAGRFGWDRLHGRARIPSASRWRRAAHAEDDDT